MFARALLTFELGAELPRLDGVLRLLAPSEATLFARAPVDALVRFLPEPWEELSETLDGGERALLGAAERLSGEGRVVRAEVELGVELAPLVERARAMRAEVVAFGAFDHSGPRRVLGWMREVARALDLPVLWFGDRACGPLRHVALPFDGDTAALAQAAALLRDRGGAAERITILTTRRSPLEWTEQLVSLAAVAGLRAPVSIERLVPAGWSDPIEAWACAHEVDLLLIPATASVLPEWLRAPLKPEAPRVPRLLLPPLPEPTAMAIYDAADGLRIDGEVRLRVETRGLFDAPEPVDGELRAVSGGRVVAAGVARAGYLTLPLDDDAVSELGLARGSDGEPLAQLAGHFAWLRADGAALLPFDAAADDAQLVALRERLAQGDPPARALAVRLRPDHSFAAVRARLGRAGLAGAAVVDAATVLDEGALDDVRLEVDPVRFGRVVARLRAAGYRVPLFVARDGSITALPPLPSNDGSPRALRLDATTAALALGGHRVQIDLDNGAARRALVAAIDGARASVHLQQYIVRDDAVARLIGAALLRAAGRGVAVRLLVDSLYSLHGSFGLSVPLLDELVQGGVAVRPSRPVPTLPSLVDLKQRDHRKVVVIDGALGFVGGRNLGANYYLGFDEVALSAASPWDDVPWLDAGVRLEGPGVGMLEAAFLREWSAAGGAPFTVAAPVPAGAVRVRVVEHRGLADAYTLEAYLALVDTARATLHVVNTFPLQLEMQHALLRALRRNVRVRLLIGSVRPRHGADEMPFVGGWVRELADALVRARVDALVEAGAEAYELALHDVAGWAPELEMVRPHVHAKIVSADGECCAIGSANLDVTAGYWESEALVVVEDHAVTARLEQSLDGLMAGSGRVDRDAPAWRRAAGRRAWLGRHWPNLIG